MCQWGQSQYQGNTPRQAVMSADGKFLVVSSTITTGRSAKLPDRVSNVGWGFHIILQASIINYAESTFTTRP